MKTVPNDKSFSGSMVLERGTSFVARQIILWMAVYAWKTGRKPLKYSHAETLLWDENLKRMYTVGAREKGTRISPAEYYYGKHEIMILKPVVPLTDVEIRQQWRYFYAIDKSKYQYSNFLSWIYYIVKGVWLGQVGEKRNYCYELAARFSFHVQRWPVAMSLERVSIYELAENNNYKSEQ